MKKRLLDPTVWKFLLVGALNTLVGSGVMFLLYNLAHAGYWLSVFANYLAGGMVSFLLNKYFTFQNRDRSAAQVARFALTVAVCALIAYGLARPLVGWALTGSGPAARENGGMPAATCL